jgi:hypothetical protein
MIYKEYFQGIIDQLIELDESRRIALDQMMRNQDKVKGTFDHKSRDMVFKEGDEELLWNKGRKNQECIRNLIARVLDPTRL